MPTKVLKDSNVKVEEQSKKLEACAQRIEKGVDKDHSNLLPAAALQIPASGDKSCSGATATCDAAASLASASLIFFLLRCRLDRGRHFAFSSGSPGLMRTTAVQAAPLLPSLVGLNFSN